MTRIPPKVRFAGFIALLAIMACQERLIDGEVDQLEGYTICTMVTGARVYDGEGNAVGAVLDEDGRSSEVCLCLSLEDAKSGIYEDEFNDMALEACLEDAARMGYPEANDCADWHASGEWKDWIDLYPWNEDEPCDLEGDNQNLDQTGGCSVL